MVGGHWAIRFKKNKMLVKLGSSHPLKVPKNECNFYGATHMHQIYPNTIDGRNLANQLRLVMYRIIYRDLYIPGGDSRISEPSTVSPYRFTIWNISINSKDSSRFRCAPLDGLEHVEESLHFNDRSTKDIPCGKSIHINQWFQILLEKPSEWVILDF